MDALAVPTQPSDPPMSSTSTPRPHRLRAVPSSRAGVADVPLSPTGQKRFYSLHDGLLALGAKEFGSVDEIEDEVLREQEEEDKRLAAEAAAEPGDDALDLHLPPHSRSGSPASDDEVVRMLIPPRRPGLSDSDTKVRIMARGTAETRKGADFDFYGFSGADSAQNERHADAEMENDEEEEEGEPEKDVDGLPLEDDDDVSMVPIRPSEPTMQTTAQDKTSEKNSMGKDRKKKGKKRMAETTDSEADQAGKVNYATLFLQYWRDNVSKLHPPHVWYTKGPSAAPGACEPASSVPSSLPPSIDNTPAGAAASTPSDAPSTPARAKDLFGCTVTLTFPDSTLRTFSTPEIHASRSAARRAVFALAYESGTHEEAARMRVEFGWEKEAQEEKAEKERLRKLKGGERPWAALKAEQERWMAEPTKFRFETEELNSVHSCILTVPVLPSSEPLVFTTPQTFHSHREAKDAAARLALDADVPTQYERAFKERLKRDSGGYIQFGDINLAEVAAEFETEEEADGDESERDGPLDSIALLNREVKAAFGGLQKWLGWKHDHAADSTPQKTLLGATLTMPFPVTAAHPQPPPPFTVSVPPLYHTKHHALLACIVAAFREGLVDSLAPYKREREEEKERAQEERKKKEDERRAEREKGLLDMPRAGTVKYEDLVKLANPSAYLNTCAQQWTGNGSPLKFAYSIQHVEGSNVKHYGCTVTVFVNIGLDKSFTVDPSPALTTRRAAKDAAVRLALEEHVLDLLMPAGFDPRKPLPTKRDVMEDVWAPKEPISRPSSCVSAFNCDGLAGPLKPRPTGPAIRDAASLIGAATTPASARPTFGADEPAETTEALLVSVKCSPAEGNVPAASAQANAALESSSDLNEPSKANAAPPFSSTAVTAPSLATDPPARHAATNGTTYSKEVPPSLEQSAVPRLDQLCTHRLGYGYLPEYEVRQNFENGLFAASVRMPLEASPSPLALHSPRPILQHLVTFAVDFTHGSRTAAEEAVANLALTSDIVTEWASRTTMPANPTSTVTVDRGPCIPQPDDMQLASTSENVAQSAPTLADPRLVADPRTLLTRKRGCSDAATGDCPPAGTCEVSHEPAAKRAKLDTAAVEVVSGAQAEAAAAGGPLIGEAVKGSDGGRVEALRLGCREVLGAEAKVEPLYTPIVKGDLFGAAVVVPLDKHASDSRTFSHPALYTSLQAAYEGVAHIALQAGILELLDSRVNPKAKPASSPRDGKELKGPGRGGKKQANPPRTEEEQAALRRASYGGFGAATAYQLAKMRAQAAREKEAVDEGHPREPEKEARKELPLEVEGNPLLPGLPVEEKGSNAEGAAMKGLRAYFESRSLAIPPIHREPSTTPGKTADHVRIWLTHQGLRFELPAARASKAEEKLAAKVLKYLKTQEEEQEAKKTA